MRREERRTLQKVRGWITGMGRPLTGCFVEDISNGGARLFIERGHPPDEFYLYFSPHGLNFRKCKVRWRRGDRVGIEFVWQSRVIEERASEEKSSTVNL
jgi:hypothetical protein